jgi:hypothetical protein
MAVGSLDSYTTRGVSALVVGVPWRMMEAVDSVLLFGLTTAFLFAVMQVWWPIWMARRYGLNADGVHHARLTGSDVEWTASAPIRD